MPHALTIWAIRARYLLSRAFENWLRWYRYFEVKVTLDMLTVLGQRHSFSTNYRMIISCMIYINIYVYIHIHTGKWCRVVYIYICIYTFICFVGCHCGFIPSSLCNFGINTRIAFSSMHINSSPVYSIHYSLFSRANLNTVYIHT